MTTHANAVLDLLILNVPLVTMELTGMKENVEVFAQQDTGKTQQSVKLKIVQIPVKDVMDHVLLVPEEPNMIVKNHAQKVFTGIMDSVSVLVQMEHMKMTPQSQLVNHAT